MLTPDDAYGHDCEEQSCLCPKCSPDDGGEPEEGCMKDFCALCLEELGYDSRWPDLCGRCIAEEAAKHDLA